MKNFKKGGFTLIELLVVLAIIAILAAIVLAALSNSRDKGADAGVKNQLINARAQAEVFFNTNTAAANTYTNVCTNGIVGGAKGIGEYVQNAAKAAGLAAYATNAAGSTTTATCNHSAGAFAVEVPLKASGQMWCIDSTGKSKQVAGTSLSGAADYTCS